MTEKEMMIFQKYSQKQKETFVWEWDETGLKSVEFDQPEGNSEETNQDCVKVTHNGGNGEDCTKVIKRKRNLRGEVQIQCLQHILG